MSEFIGKWDRWARAAPKWQIWSALLALTIVVLVFPGALVGLGLAYFLGSDLTASALAGGAIGAGLMLMWRWLR